MTEGMARVIAILLLAAAGGLVIFGIVATVQYVTADKIELIAADWQCVETSREPRPAGKIVVLMDVCISYRRR